MKLLRLILTLSLAFGMIVPDVALGDCSCLSHARRSECCAHVKSFDSTTNGTASCCGNRKVEEPCESDERPQPCQCRHHFRQTPLIDAQFQLTTARIPANVVAGNEADVCIESGVRMGHECCSARESPPLYVQNNSWRI